MKKVLYVLLLLVNTCPAQVNLNLGLKAYYPFTGNANDVSGNNNNPVFNNATLTQDRFGNPNSAYHFNGSSSYMQVPNSASLNMGNKISLCAWVKPAGFYSGTCHGNSILMKGDADYLPGNYLLRYDDAAGTNNNNCTGTVNPTVENFYGNDAIAGPPGYTPYIQQGLWYSVIVTLDGTTARLYINCQLKFSAPQVTTTLTNSYDLFFGRLNSSSFPYWVNGDMDEIRIYDRALTFDEVNVLGGCTSSAQNIGGIINSYTPVLSYNICENKLTVEDATAFHTGDTVLLIQMKGAVADSSNTATFGTITDYKNSGNYEFNYVKSKAGNILELKNKLTRQYDIPLGKVQLVRVPYYSSVSVTSTLTCLPWDGSKGGILVLNARDTVSLQANIDVSGNGFKGGAGYNPGNQSLTCFQNDYYYAPNTIYAAQRGESISTLSVNKGCGKGSLAGAGGGGMGHNSGGGGGGNGGIGGYGGYQLDNCGNAPYDNRGLGGRQMLYSTASNKIFMGSGGGAGHEDNIGTPPSNGGNGAGIIIIMADKIQANAQKIMANAYDGSTCVVGGSVNCHDGMGGGGAGGSVLIHINQFIDNAVIENKGGKGADVTGDVIAGGKIGAGGGGGGGLAFLKSASLPANLTITNTGGANGVLTLGGNNAWGTTPGAAGLNLYNLVLPIDNTPFQKNIDSVRIKDSLTSCLNIDFKGLGYTNTSAITNWQWYFGDGGTANTQNTSHGYATAGTYTVKLVVTDLNGCMDSVSKNVNTNVSLANAGSDTSLCASTTVSVTLHGNPPGATYLWSPAIYLNNPTLQNPVATISSTTTFFLTVSSTLGCNGTDSVTITIDPLPVVKTLNDTGVCRGSTLVLTTTTGLSTYHWSPGSSVSDSTVSSPLFIDTATRTLYITGTSARGCRATDTLLVTVKPLPGVKTINDTTICSTNTLTLQTTGAQSYSWSPTIFLSNPNIANPVYSGNQSLSYVVTGTGLNGCSAKDTVSISVNLPNSMQAPPDKAMCQGETVQLDGHNGTYVSYLWSPGTYLSSTTLINPLAFPPTTTPYNLLITDRACNYSSAFTVLVTVNPLPVVNARKSNDIDCANRSALLSASGGITYTWLPSTGLNNSNIPNPVATPNGTQLYHVTVTNASGCTQRDSLWVFNNLAASLARYMPNAFTPNGDGVNDCYGLKNWLNIRQLEFMIFNRWGEKVFSTTHPDQCWDGNYKGVKALAGTYAYYIKAQTDCGVEEQKGNFILIR
jgi:gliding motility-associated-like protein